MMRLFKKFLFLSTLCVGAQLTAMDSHVHTKSLLVERCEFETAFSEYTKTWTITAFLDGQEVGYVDYRCSSNGSAVIRLLEVDELWRCNGIGRTLLQRAIDAVQEQDVSSIQVLASPIGIVLLSDEEKVKRKKQLHDLYAGFGFASVGKHELMERVIAIAPNQMGERDLIANQSPYIQG